jgi:hypothetical protein
MTLSQLVVDSSYKFLKVSKEQDNERELVRLDYTYVYDNPKPGNQAKGGGSLFLDPSQCWCIRRAKRSSRMMSNGVPQVDQEHEIEFETIDHPSGFPLVKTQTSRDSVYSYKTKKRLVTTSRIDYEWEVNDSVPDSEFTLSAFGLPEPAGETVKKPIPFYVWILIGAGVCAALALGFRYLARRARLKPAA